MIDRYMEEIDMIGDNNEFDRLIKKNLNELEVVEAELMVAKSIMEIEMITMEVEREIKK